MNKVILLIDDDIDDQEFFLEAVKEVNPNITCHLAGSCDEGLEFLNNSSVLPDYIFLDLNMPMMNGKEFLQELKKTESFGHIPVIIYTTSSRPEDREQSLSLGATDFLVKPNNYKSFCEQLKTILIPQ